MGKREYKKITLIVVVAIFVLGIGMRFSLFSKMIPTFEDLSAIPFAKESASHYRYAKMIAEEKPIPSPDRQAQHPEGLEVTHDSIMEEYVVGYLYRVFPFQEIPFHRFVSYFVILFSSLSIFAVFHLSRQFTRTRAAGLFATLLYTVSLPSILRNIGTEFAREHFSLPFLFFHTSFFVKSIDAKSSFQTRLTSAIISGLCLFIALASWKLCRFYFLIFVLFVLLQFLLKKETRILRVPVLVLFAFAFVSGLSVPHLRADLFLTSTPMILMYSMILVGVIDQFVRPIGRTILKTAFVFGTSVGLYVLLPQTSRFGHVYYTALYQILFLFRHPQDPSRLPPEARLYWVPGYTHPSLYNFLAYFTLPLVTGVYGVARSIRDVIRGRTSVGEQFLLYSLAATFISYIFFSRLHVFFIFFLTVFMGRSIDLLLTRFQKKIFVYAMVGLIGVHQVYQVVIGWDPLRVMSTLGIQPVREEIFLENVFNLNDVIRWIESNTEPESVFLSYWHTSAQILAYADRSTVLHTFFEDANMRRKIIEFAHTLYNSERAFFSYCEKYGVNYFIYSSRYFLDDSIVGTRFLADRLSLNSNCFTHKAHFYPEKLARFSLRYQNDCFRVYKVLEGAEPKVDEPVDYQPVFDPKYATNNMETMRQFGEQFSYASFLYYSGLETLKRGRPLSAIQLLQNSISVLPTMHNAWILLAALLEGQGFTEEACTAYQQVLRLNPRGPSAGEATDALRRLRSPSVGAYLFEGSDSEDIDTTFMSATLSLNSDSTFTLSNPGFQDKTGRTFSIVESGAYSVADTTITFAVVRQEPEGFDYYYLFGRGDNRLTYRSHRGTLLLKGASSAGGIVTLTWKRR
ncbi:MAG: hypothetical protein JSV84_16690 [Gemmatimonadota bacterium]|nr:MAG: hypothetical protein JSV84_16690 [Gemmatimonadota bacterium]